MTPFGPYETESDAAAEPMPRAVGKLPRRPLYSAGDPGRASRDLQLSFLREACADAGVELGRYDERILAWLCNYEPVTVQVFIGLISRAHAAGAAQIGPVRELVTAWHTDRTAFPDGAAPVLEQVAELLGVDVRG